MGGLGQPCSFFVNSFSVCLSLSLSLSLSLPPSSSALLGFKWEPFFVQFLGPGASFLPSLHVSHQFAPCTSGLRSLCGSSTMLLGS
ncbi:hypothetical protein NC652_037255 [Populus alba x Populus x berolinensis]|nr:hypothetical protein NC652_037255 [Populus alba x Populus x berolinensis]